MTVILIIICSKRRKEEEQFRRETMHRRHAYAFETLNISYITSKARRKASETFPQTIGFMIAIQDQVNSTDNCKKLIFKNPNTTNDICSK